MTMIPFILFINFLFSFPNSFIFFSRLLTVLMKDWMTFIGGFLANNGLICACYTLDSLISSFFYFVNHRRILFVFIVLFIPLFFVQVFFNRHCHILNHWYYDSFHRYHLHNLLYIKIVETFCVGFIFMNALDNPLEIFFCDWLFLGLVPLLESKQLVFTFYFFCRE